MAKPRSLNITILNWDKFNPRKDVKNPSWFRLEHSLFEDPEFYDLNHSQLLFWIYLLSNASKKNGPAFILSFAHAERVGRFKLSDIEDGLEILQTSGCIHVDVTPTSRPRDGDVTDTIATRRDETDVHAEPELEPVRSDSVTAVEPGPFDEILKTKKVSGDVQRAWIETYEDPGWIEFELKKAITWTLAQKSRAPKSNFAKFFSGWLSRSWDSHRKTIPITQAAKHDSFCGIGEP